MRRGEPIINVFARSPIRGRVKSRLAADLGEVRAASIYRRLLRRTLDQAAAADGRTVVWVDGGRWHPAWRNVEAHRLKVQPAGDLGRRMAHALRWSLSRCRGALVVGSDCPGVSAALLNQALDRLREVDLILGPAADGGYYLIGMSRLFPQLFRGIEWSESEVLATTLARARRLGLTHAKLRTLRDVDRAEDVGNA